MKKYTQRQQATPKTIQSKASNQASAEEVLQSYKKKIVQMQSMYEDEPLQGKFTDTAQREELDEEELLQGKFDTAQREEIDEDELLQGKFEDSSTVQRAETPPIGGERANNTGMPDNLKNGIESLSGYSMDDVRVHYNSPKPAQLQALAYAQGTDIHIAPGQEQHLPHEAWHVVQQKQGRVQPTMQMQGVSVNDSEGLEREADVMGGISLSNTIKQKAIQKKASNRVVQKVDDETLLETIEYSDVQLPEKMKKDEEEPDYVKYEAKKIRIRKFEGDVSVSDQFGGCLMAVFNIEISKFSEKYKDSAKEKFKIEGEDEKTPYIAHISTGSGDTDSLINFFYACKEQKFINVHYFKPYDKKRKIKRKRTEDMALDYVKQDPSSARSYDLAWGKIEKTKDGREQYKASSLWKFIDEDNYYEVPIYKYDPIINIDISDAFRKYEQSKGELYNEIMKIVSPDEKLTIDEKMQKKCYLTTACVIMMGLPDDCEELTILRQFRDTYLINKPNGNELINIYYNQAPQILNNIHRHVPEEEEAILLGIYKIIKDCVYAIKQGNNEYAFRTYCDMVVALDKEFN